MRIHPVLGRGLGMAGRAVVGALDTIEMGRALLERLRRAPRGILASEERLGDETPVDAKRIKPTIGRIATKRKIGRVIGAQYGTKGRGHKLEYWNPID
mgnify:CR=1 FL=1